MESVGSDNSGSPAAEAPARRALLLVNRKARNGGAPVDAALNVLRGAGIEVDEGSCEDAGAMLATVRARAADLDMVVVGGGDGTLNCVVRALIGTDLPMGILPLGTANDLARTLGIPPDPVAAARIIAAGAIREIDLGEVNGHPYFNVASIGFSAELARGLTREAKRRWGVVGYALAGLKLLVRTQPFTAYIEHEGVTEKVKTLQVSVGNGRHYGGGMTVDITAEPDDGRFHVYSLEVDHWWRLLALVPWLRRGTHGSWQDVRVFTASDVTVRTRRARSVNTDGELTTATPAVFRLLPKAVRVFAPADHRSSAALP